MARSGGERSCLQAALAILEYADNTERQLREKLLSRGYREEEVDAAIGALRAKKLLDERDIALRFLRSEYERGRGPARIRADLRRRGFSRENLALCEALLAGEGGEGDAEAESLQSFLDFPAKCAILLEKIAKSRGFELLLAFYRGEETPRERREELRRERERAAASLMRRGYSPEDYRAAERLLRETLSREDE